MAEVLQSVEGSLFDAQFFLLSKGVDANGGIENPKFAGIASCESMDAEGDTILKSILDVSYASKRGYVNWDHSRQISDQIGFLTRCEIIESGQIASLEKALRTPLSKNASVYVEGELYGHAKHAQEVATLLKSIPDGAPGALGLSVEGGKVVDKTTGKLKKAIVRGVAITPVPAHPDTCARIMKSLGLAVNDSVEGVELSKSVAGLTRAEAVIKVMEMRPEIPLSLAKQIVNHVFNKHR